MLTRFSNCYNGKVRRLAGQYFTKFTKMLIRSFKHRSKLCQKYQNLSLSSFLDIVLTMFSYSNTCKVERGITLPVFNGIRSKVSQFIKTLIQKPCAKYQDPCSSTFLDIVLTRLTHCNKGKVERGTRESAQKVIRSSKLRSGFYF